MSCSVELCLPLWSISLYSSARCVGGRLAPLKTMPPTPAPVSRPGPARPRHFGRCVVGDGGGGVSCLRVTGAGLLVFYVWHRKQPCYCGVRIFYSCFTLYGRVVHIRAKQHIRRFLLHGSCDGKIFYWDMEMNYWR